MDFGSVNANVRTIRLEEQEDNKNEAESEKVKESEKAKETEKAQGAEKSKEAGKGGTDPIIGGGGGVVSPTHKIHDYEKNSKIIT